MKNNSEIALTALAARLAIDPQAISEILTCFSLFKKRKAHELASIITATTISPAQLMLQEQQNISQFVEEVLARYKQGYLIPAWAPSTVERRDLKGECSLESTIGSSEREKQTPHFEEGSCSGKRVGIPQRSKEVSEFEVWRPPQSWKIKERIMGQLDNQVGLLGNR